MIFWTMDDSDGLPAVTLCARHALEATNIGCAPFGLGPWESMQTAAAELDAIASIFGGDLLGFTTSEEGYCEECEHELKMASEEIARQGGDAA